MSGRLAKRPDWDRRREYLRAGDTLVVTRLSRVARSTRNLLEVSAWLAEHEISATRTGHLCVGGRVMRAMIGYATDLPGQHGGRPPYAASMDQAHPPAVRRLTVRTATARDLPHLHAIATRAVTELLDRHYSSAQIRAAEKMKMHEVEADLVEAGTYYVAEVDGEVVAGSGWSAGGSLQRSANGPIVESGTATMRASYVDPRYARRGIATLLARTTETAATLSGFRRFETMCTPLSAAMRSALGYRLVRHEQIPLADGLTLRLAVMRKQLPDLPGGKPSKAA